MKVIRYVWYWIPVIGYMAIIWFISSMSIVSHGGISVSDKILHMIEFFILAYLVFYAVANTISPRYAYVVAILGTAVYGIIDEFHQSFVPSRAFSYLDMLADAIGGLFVLVRKSWK
jgi:VanZ family protein